MAQWITVWYHMVEVGVVVETRQVIMVFVTVTGIYKY